MPFSGILIPTEYCILFGILNQAICKKLRKKILLHLTFSQRSQLLSVNLSLGC